MKASYVYLSIFTLILAVSAMVIASFNGELVSKTNDALLTAQVKSAFFFHPTTKSPSIHVETNQAKVSLKGEVDTAEERKIAAFLSQTIPGVESVDTKQLVVKNAHTSNTGFHS